MLEAAPYCQTAVISRWNYCYCVIKIYHHGDFCLKSWKCSTQKGQENLVHNLNQAWFFHNFEMLVFYIIFIALCAPDWISVLIEWHWLQNSACQDSDGCYNMLVDILNSLSSVPSYCCGAAWLSCGNCDGRYQDQWIWAGSRVPAVCKQSCYCLSC